MSNPIIWPFPVHETGSKNGPVAPADEDELVTRYLSIIDDRRAQTEYQQDPLGMAEYSDGLISFALRI